MHGATQPERRSHTPNTSPAAGVLTGCITTLHGEHVTAGTVELSFGAEAWTARLTKLERPGVVASMFFGHRLREVILRLEDGREARARIVTTTFVTGGERECQLVGLEPLVQTHESDQELAA
jgi:hypothetical protein